jgi:hypothetical protein
VSIEGVKIVTKGKMEESKKRRKKVGEEETPVNVRG